MQPLVVWWELDVCKHLKRCLAGRVLTFLKRQSPEYYHFACPNMIIWVIIISNSPFLPTKHDKEGNDSVSALEKTDKGIRS